MNHDIDDLARRMMPSAAEIRQRLDFLELDAAEMARLKAIHPWLIAHQHEFIDDFYTHLLQFSPLKAMVGGDDGIARLKHTQGKYFSSLSCGEYDNEYVHHRLRVGIVHQQIGLEPPWYIGAYRKYLSGLIPLIARLTADDPAALIPTWDALLKVVCFDMSLALDTYIQARQQEILDLKNQSEHMASHDPLTGLANRSLLMDRLSQALTYANRANRHVAVMFIDLDRFKNINDSLGHDAGDRVIVEVGERLQHSIRDGDTVARLGGDEFVVVLSDVAREDEVAQVAGKILAALERPMSLLGQELSPVGSIGISLYPKDGEDCQSLLKNADAAMYRAKHSGRNHFQFYAQEMNARTFDRLRLESRLRGALARNEFCLHYQPQVAICSGRITGMEALLRWQPPGDAMVMPGDFIPIAEETGLIVAIGEWVLRTACAQMALWHQAGWPTLRVAVNLSARQFRQHELEQMVARVLRETACEASNLELEITESVIMEDPQSAIETLQHLSSMGIHLAIDDFGTGHSSLSYLKRFPIHTLKVDHSFVGDISTDADDAAIVRAVIVLAHSMKLKVVAEGVETQEQLDFLREQHCDLMQGYFFAKPLTTAEMTGLLQNEGSVTVPLA